MTHRVLAVLLLTAAPAAAQPLTLEAAIARALEAHPDLAAARASETEARHGVAAARAGWFPQVELQEGWQRGDQPVFVFGSLLSQRRFTQANFAVDALNNPDATDNYRAAALLSQPIWDGGRTTAASEAASAGVRLATAAAGQARADVAFAVTQAYGQALVADAAAAAAESAVAAAAEDLARTTARRDAGMATDADVLALDVHLAQMRTRRIAAASDADVARATLNRLMGAPVDTAVQLATLPPSAAPAAPKEIAALPADAKRWDVEQAAARVDLARAHARAARAPLLPSIGFQAGYEWNGGNWSERAGSWIAGVRGTLSLSLAGGQFATFRAAQASVSRAEAHLASAESAADVDVRAATSRLASSQSRLQVSSAAVAQARESARIIRDRYGSGLATVTDLLRSSNALLDAEALDVDARVGVIVAGAALDRALGRTPGTKE